MAICPQCKKEFEKKTARHTYCCRACFKICYNRKQRLERSPTFVCPQCGNKTQLDFSPIRNASKWFNFKCDFCGYSISSCD